MLQGVSAANSGDTKQAIKRLEEAVKRDPKLWEARFDLGVLLAQTGELERAEDELEKALDSAPNAEDVVVALAEVKRRRRDAQGAADVLTTFVKAHDEAIAARIALVSALRESGRIDEAISRAQEVLVRRSGDPNALAELALSHLARGEVDTAELLITEALKAEDKKAVVERTAGLIALERGDDAMAFKHFVRASELDPKDTTARLNMGTVLLQAGVYDAAEKEFRAVLAVKKDDDDATVGLAAALRGQGTRYKKEPYSKAERLLKELLDRKPRHLAATYNLAILYTDYLQRPTAAKPLLKRFLEDAPEKHPARPEAKRRLSGIK